MLTGEIAKHQIQDRIRAAERDRVARSSHGYRDRGRTPVVRRVGSGLLAAVVVYRRNTSSTSAAIEVRFV
jgi:hypothetical protein